MDLPARFYSSGMTVRLGFGLATAIRPQILVMDEWFLAGDSSFIAKARARLERLVSSAEILVLSSHLEHIVLEWATRCLWLENGTVRQDGPARGVLEAYLGRRVDKPAHTEPVSTS
jgi:lipopolysaccharide transport system ATP-binding protein